MAQKHLAHELGSPQQVSLSPSHLLHSPIVFFVVELKRIGLQLGISAKAVSACFSETVARVIQNLFNISPTAYISTLQGPRTLSSASPHAISFSRISPSASSTLLPPSKSKLTTRRTSPKSSPKSKLSSGRRVLSPRTKSTTKNDIRTIPDPQVKRHLEF